MKLPRFQKQTMPGVGIELRVIVKHIYYQARPASYPNL